MKESKGSIVQLATKGKGKSKGWTQFNLETARRNFDCHNKIIYINIWVIEYKNKNLKMKVSLKFGRIVIKGNWIFSFSLYLRIKIFFDIVHISFIG